jgi:serine/threonine protein phosphatase PrpC
VGYTVGDPGSAGRKVRATRVVGPSGWPDTAVDSVSLEGLEVRAASVRGLLHRSRHIPRQDAYSLGNGDEPLVLTVCDGVGSLGLSHEAAQHAAARLSMLLPEYRSCDGVDWDALFRALSDELAKLRQDRIGDDAPCQQNDMATTVLTAVLTRLPGSGLRVELAWVGDSEPYLLRRGNWRRLSTERAAGNHADEDGRGLVRPRGTAALPATHPVVRTYILDLMPGDVLVLVSDGIADPLGDGTGLVGGALIEWWSQPPDALEFASQVSFKRKGFFDDRTAVAVWMADA